MSITPGTVRRDTRVFISAVTRELGSIRKLVKKVLEHNDYHAVEQDTFPPDYRDLIDKLRSRIESCDAVVHIAGQCYGAEPEHRSADAPRRSYTQLEHDIAVEMGKPVYVFLTGDGFPVDPHDPEPDELRELQEAHRRRLTSTGRDYNPTASAEQLDQKVRSLQLKVERLGAELHHVDHNVVVTGRRLRRWIALVAVLSLAVLGSVGYVGWRQRVERLVLEENNRKAEAERQAQAEERRKAEAARKDATKIKQVQREFAERFLQQLLTNKEITAEEARRRALKELPALVELPLADIESLIDRKISPRAAEPRPSPLDRARAALAKGNYEEVFETAGEQKQQGRELAMLEGTAALARFRQSPDPKWNELALAAFRRAMALADADSPTEWEAWTDAAVSVALVLDDLARYAETETLLRRCLRLRESHSGPGSSRLAVVLNNLAIELQATNRLAQSEPLMRRAMAIDERLHGPDHPKIAVYLNNLAILFLVTNRLAEAEPLMRRAMAIDERSYDLGHTRVSADLNNLASLLKATNRLAEAEPLMRRALAVDERSYGPGHPRVAANLNNLASLLQATNRLAEAEPLMRRAMTIDERSYGPGHTNVAADLNNLATLLLATNRLAEAEPLMRRALAIDERSYGPDHPKVAPYLNNLASLLKATNRLAKAEPLMRRALAIDERSYGPDHPKVANRLNNLAMLLQATNRLAEAEPLMRRALAIDERSYGPGHTNVAADLNNLATLLLDTNRLAEAEPLMRRALAIDGRSYVPDHPNLRVIRSNYRELLTSLKLAEPEITARINAAGAGTDKFAPIVPEVERILGPAKPVADVLSSLDRRYQDEGKPAVFFLGRKEPIAPQLDELLRPDGEWLTERGVAAFRRGANADAIALWEAALPLVGDQPSLVKLKLQIRMNRAAAQRELGLAEEARDELARLLPEVDKVLAEDFALRGRVRFHLALCQWRLRDRDAARTSAEESIATYDGAAKETPVDGNMRQQSEDLLSALKDGKAPPPAEAIDAPAAIEAALARHRASEAMARLALDQEAAPVLDQLLGPAKPTKDVFELLDRQYREQGKPASWFVPLTEPMAPHLDQLLGPARSTKEVLDALDRSYHEQKKPAFWTLPLDQPIGPHLDELLGKSSG